MTSSFVKILARHEGPWKLCASLPVDAKGRSSTMWIGMKTDDPVGTALGILEDSEDSIVSIKAWSESEQQFVLTIDKGDRAVWDAEKENWKQKVRELARAEAAELPKREIKAPQGVAASDTERVLTLRASGMGYVAIEKEFGIENKKGFWAWKIVKAAEKAQQKS